MSLCLPCEHLENPRMVAQNLLFSPDSHFVNPKFFFHKAPSIISLFYRQANMGGKVVDARPLQPALKQCFPGAPGSFLKTLFPSGHRSHAEHSHPSPGVRGSTAILCPQGQGKPSPAGHHLLARSMVASGASLPPVFCPGTGRTALVRDKLFEPSTPVTFIYTSILCFQQVGHFPHYSSMWYYNTGCRCSTLSLFFFF